MLSVDEKNRLKIAAEAASRCAYNPYSKFAVGAALLCEDGSIIPGANVENVSFGLTNCAERTALYSAIAHGHKATSFVAIAIYTPTNKITTPCGACRQVMAELMQPTATVLSFCENGILQQWSVAELLPDSFDF